MTTYYHGSRSALVAHCGVCLTTDSDAASKYGPVVSSVSLSLSGLNVVDCNASDAAEFRARLDDQSFPGDSARSRAEYLAAGADVLLFADADAAGREHDCYRFISARALALLG